MSNRRNLTVNPVPLAGQLAWTPAQVHVVVTNGAFSGNQLVPSGIPNFQYCQSVRCWS